MNLVDAALVVLLTLCAVRGFLRGLLREVFSLAALLVGLYAAMRWALAGAAELESLLPEAGLPEAALSGVVFVLVFLVVSAAVNLLGFVGERMLGGGVLRQLSRVAGAGFAAAKGVVILAFTLLFFHLFPFVEGFDHQLQESRLARPMIAAAEAALSRSRGARPSAEGRA
jgi:membrane protein required for colicin V production